MNISTIIVLAIVAALFVLAVRSIVRGGATECSSCSAECSYKNCASCTATAKLLEDMDCADKASRVNT